MSGASWVTQTAAPRSASIIWSSVPDGLVDLGDPAHRLVRPREVQLADLQARNLLAGDLAAQGVGEQAS